MKRKVIQLAGSTLVVSLPSKWAAAYNVLKGDEIEIEEQGNRLCISSNHTAAVEKAQLNLVGAEHIARRALGALYKGGYDEVEVEYEPQELAALQEVIREEYLGFEVLYRGKSRLTVKNVTSLNLGEFETVLKRMFFVIEQMGEESLEAAHKRDLMWLKTIVFMDRDVNKYSTFCRRTINKHGHAPVRSSAPLYYIAEQLERVGDSYRDICTYLQTHPGPLSSETLRVYKEVNLFFKQLFSLFYSFELKGMDDFMARHAELRTALEQLAQSCPKGERRVVLYLFCIFENIFDLNGPMMTVRL